MTRDRGEWLDRVTNGRIDIAMAVVLLAFFYYKGGAKLVFFLVVIFLILVALFHISSWLIRRYNLYRHRTNQSDFRSAAEQDPTDHH